MSDKNDVVVINLDRPRMLRFGHKAIKTLKALTGKYLEELWSFENGYDGEAIEKVAYCALLSDAKAHNEDLKLEDMEDLLDQAPTYFDIVAKVSDAMRASYGNFAVNNDSEKNAQGIVDEKK